MAVVRRVRVRNRGAREVLATDRVGSWWMKWALSVPNVTTSISARVRPGFSFILVLVPTVLAL
jgi:hypothetical protein